MTKSKLNKFADIIIEEIVFYADEHNMEPHEFITKIQEEKHNVDEFGNPSDSTFIKISKDYNLPISVASSFWYLH
jgi:hypothetical protein